MRRNEKNLVEKAAKGDSVAFGEIVRRYQTLVYAQAMQVAKDPASAQDIAQESFISAFRALKDLRSKESFPSWLRTITRNKALAWKRDRRRLVPLEEAGTLPSPPDPSPMEEEAERNEADSFEREIGRIVSELSDTLRFPVLLCYLDGVSTAETACFLGIKEGTVRKRLHDGKKKLQERIVKMAEMTFQEYRLPRDFARRCICGCRAARKRKNREGTPERG